MGFITRVNLLGYCFLYNHESEVLRGIPTGGVGKTHSEVISIQEFYRRLSETKKESKAEGTPLTIRQFEFDNTRQHRTKEGEFNARSVDVGITARDAVCTELN